MSEMLSVKQQRARDAEAMAFERANRPPTPAERQKAQTDAAWQRWSVMERHLVVAAPAWTMPAGNACPFAVEGALWVERNRPELKGDDFLAAVQAYRNERLERLSAPMSGLVTESWLGAPWDGEL